MPYMWNQCRKAKKICGNCGTEIKDGISFCLNCGTQVKSSGLQNSVHTVLDSKIKKVNFSRKNISIAAIIVGAIIIAVILFGGRSCEKVVDMYVKASLTADVNTMWKLFPKEMQELIIEEAEEEEYLSGEKEVIEYMRDQLQTQLDSLNEQLGDKWDITYEIVETEDYEGTTLREYIRELREDGWNGFDADDAKNVEVEIIISSKDGESEVSRTMYLTLVKIGRKWYLADV